MPTLVVKTIGTTGRDYSTMQAWEDACPANLVSADQVWKGECYKDSEFTAPLTGAGVTTDATRYMWLSVAAGQALGDNIANPLDFDATKGAAWRVTGSYATIYAGSTQYTRIDRLQIYYDSAYSSNYYTPVQLSSNDVVSGILYKSRRTAAANVATQPGVSVTNSVFIDAGTGMSGGSGLLRLYGDAQAYNCTFIRATDLTASSCAIGFTYPSSPTIRNCLFLGAFSNLLGSSPTMSGTTGYNATSLASVPFGSNNVAGLTPSAEIAGSTSAGIDARSVSGNHLAAGARDASHTADKDFAGQSRSTSTPSIGAWEYISGGGGPASYSYTAAGGFVLSGSATKVRGIARTASGGATFSGAATKTRGTVKSAAGGILFAGAASTAKGKAVTASGGLTISGAATKVRGIARAAAGGLQLAGAAGVSFFSAVQSRVVNPIGGIVISGAAVLVRARRWLASAGITFSGIAGITRTFAGATPAAFNQSTIMRAAVTNRSVPARAISIAASCTMRSTFSQSTIMRDYPINTSATMSGAAINRTANLL